MSDHPIPGQRDAGAVTVLPPPPADRWRPARAGLTGLWRYWDETFEFHRGRLLLRGPNGSGKSMALELLLPFLLDADASPGKLSSSVRSRGGLFERVMTGSSESTRAGFAWVEFRRGEQVFTVGARLRASQSTHRTDVDYFTTDLAVGHELRLLDDQRVALSRKALAEAMGPRGRIHSSGEEHRNAVREALFPGFGPDRYQSLITALLALRKEKLSQNLDLDKLSGVLSDALPSLDEHDLATVAEGFERIDRRRAELTALEQELTEVRSLTSRQRDYARAVVANVAAQVRSAETRRDAVTREEREKTDDLTLAHAEAAAVAGDAAALADRLTSADAEIDALRATDAYRHGAALDDLRAEGRRLAELVERDRRAAERAEHEHERRTATAEEAGGAREHAAANATRALDELRTASIPVAAGAVVSEVSVAPADEGERVIVAWVGARRALVADVRRAIAAWTDAVAGRDFAAAAADDDSAVVDERVAARRQANANRREALDAYVAAVAGWSGSCTVVGADRLVAALPRPPDEPAAVTGAVSRLAGRLATETALARRELESERLELEGARCELAAEQAALVAGEVTALPPPPWRSERGGRPGAPLWELVEVGDGVEPDDVDGLEAALAGAGLLDAWVLPDGTVDLPESAADVVLAARPAEGGTLAGALVPLEGGAVAAEVVASVLQSVPVAAREAAADGREVVIGLDGTFRLGPAGGRAVVEGATRLGAAARERRRLARLAEVDAALASVDGELAAVATKVVALDTRAAAMTAELDAVPDGRELRRAAEHLADAEARLAEARDRLARARQALAEAENRVREALRALTTLGAHHQLPTTAGDLDEVASALTRLEEAARVWARRARELDAAHRAHRRAADDDARAATAAADTVADLAVSEAEATAVRVRVSTLESTVGVEYRQLINRLSALDQARRADRVRHQELADRRPELERRIGVLEAALAQAATERARADADRAEAHRRFVAAAAQGLVADAGVAVADQLDTVTAVLNAARAGAAELDGVAGDAAAVDRASARVAERLHHARAALGGRVDLDREQADEGWWVLRAASGGLRRSTRELADVLAGLLAQGRAELADDEERLFEQTLAGSVRRALADRIRLANGLVDEVNRQLLEVRTGAAGVQVRLGWDVDPEQPPAVKAARSLLLRDPADLSDAERADLQAFVRARVDQARAELEVNAPWAARLRETLDYRAWHRFTLQLAHRDWDGFKPATARRLQRLSTGERSIALHLPMLASIAAHYAGAGRQSSGCPRLILLDELFAGVDTANRAQLFGTFTTWDLDAVFTSDHEWCQYASLDGIAIHHLHQAVGDGPVTSTRFTWDGRQRILGPAA